MKNIIRKWKAHWKDVRRIKTSDHEISLGFAVGTFLVILPTPGLSILLGFLAMMLYKKISKISLFFAFAFWNPIVMIPVYSFAYSIGGFLFANSPVVSFDIVFLNQIYLFSRRFAVGLLVMSFILSIASYGLMRLILILRTARIGNKKNL